MNIKLNTLNEIERAKALNRIFRRPHVKNVEIGLNHNSQHSERIEQKISDLFNDCGCQWGAIALSFSFLISLIVLIAANAFQWQFVGWSFLIAVLTSILAKVSSLIYSHWRLARELQRLEVLHFKIQQIKN